MGRGASEGSDDDVRQLLSAYGFSNEEAALKWRKNPVNHAGKIAKAGIPCLHVVGDADKVVPVSEIQLYLKKKWNVWEFLLL